PLVGRGQLHVDLADDLRLEVDRRRLVARGRRHLDGILVGRRIGRRLDRNADRRRGTGGDDEAGRLGLAGRRRLDVPAGGAGGRQGEREVLRRVVGEAQVVGEGRVGGVAQGRVVGRQRDAPAGRRGDAQN